MKKWRNFVYCVYLEIEASNLLTKSKINMANEVIKKLTRTKISFQVIIKLPQLRIWDESNGGVPSMTIIISSCAPIQPTTATTTMSWWISRSLRVSAYVCDVCARRMSIFNNNKLYVSATCELNNDPVMLLIVRSKCTLTHTFTNSALGLALMYTNGL